MDRRFRVGLFVAGAMVAWACSGDRMTGPGRGQGMLAMKLTLMDGTIPAATSTPPIEFENQHRHGLLVELNEPIEVHEKQTTTIVLDFRLGESVTLLGRSVRDEFFFRPVVVGAREGHEDDNH